MLQILYEKNKNGLNFLVSVLLKGADYTVIREVIFFKSNICLY